MSLTAEIFRSRFHYDPSTGVITTVKRVGSRGRNVGGRVLGYESPNGYVTVRIDGRLYGSARLAWLFMTGEWPEEEIDHKDLNPSNNAWTNLRPATHQQNMTNCKMRKHNRCGVKGVGFHKQSGKYVARIRVNNQVIYLGLFTDKQLAGSAYQAASGKYHGEYGRPG